MSYNLFLDDERIPDQVGNYILPVDLRILYRKESWIIVRNYNEFVMYVHKNGLPELVSFDMDLADEHYMDQLGISNFKEKRGIDCVKWLIDYCLDNNQKFPKYMVHSMNTVGKESIIRLVENFTSSQK